MNYKVGAFPIKVNRICKSGFVQNKMQTEVNRGNRYYSKFNNRGFARQPLNTNRIDLDYYYDFW